MAVITSEAQQTQQHTNIVSGRVTLAGTSTGIPDVLVVLYDLDPATKPEETFTSGAAIDGGLDLNSLGDRIGSVLTGSAGEFSLSYDDSEFRVRNASEKRPDLQLFVLAPERPGKSTQELVLYGATDVRQNAGRVESYFVELTPEILKKAGVPIPETPAPAGDVDSAVAALGDRIRAGKKFSALRSDLLKQEIEADYTQYSADRETNFTANVRNALSIVPQTIRESDAFVPDGRNIADAVFGKVRDRIETTFNNPPPDKRPVAQGFVYLSEAQIAGYAQYVQGDEYVLPPEVVQSDILPAVFGGSASATANDFLMNHPAVRSCLRRIKGDLECAPAPSTDDGSSSGGTGTSADDEPPPAQESDISLYIARQMEHMAAPEGVVNFGVDNKARPEVAEITKHIAGLHLEQGPADSPAYFDFHVLNIAFDHVWKEAVDQGIVKASEALYDQAAVLGQQPKDLRDLVGHVQSMMGFLKAEPQQEQGGPPVEVIFEFPDAVALWPKLTPNEKTAITKITGIVLGKYRDGSQSLADWYNYLHGASTQVPYIDKEHLLDHGGLDVIAVFRQKGQNILDAAQARADDAEEAQTDLDRYRVADELANALDAQLRGRYAFTYFAADSVNRSVNFGVLLTYRQTWKPDGYSAGELVRSVPLAPKETRKFTRRTLLKKTRSEKEMEENVRITKDDTQDTSRSEAEIVRKAMDKSSFGLNTVSTFDIPLSEKIKIGNTITTNTTKDAQRDSSETKKDFRESVIKASQEYRSTRKTEVSLDTVSESERTETGEISNPNDEITVTYLFYELQRQFRVNERLHRMRPVVLVAQEMPAPHEIDDAWIVRHDWILKRVLMDDSFLHAFDCIMTVRGDELMLADFERTVIEQRKIVRDLRQNVRFYTDETGRMSRLMQAAINKEADVVEDRDFWDGIPLIGTRLNAVESAVKGVGSLLGFGQGDDPKEAARIRREGVKDAYERADRERRELMGRLEQETGVLNELTRDLATKRKDINEKHLAIARLKDHLKDHILHYMHAIWSYEDEDARYFRLYNTRVPQLTAPAANYNIRIPVAPAPSAALDAVANLGLSGADRKVRHVMYCRPVIQVEEKTLAEVAELDNLLGFKGNYMIFALRNSNVLTDFMMAPYVDSEFGLLDPDAPGNWSLEDFEQLYCCLKAQMGDEFSEIEGALKEFYGQLLQDPLRPNELINIPTDSLLIEALPGEHPVLEDFKALHRAVDVKKVQAEVRKLELENIRYAARVLAGEHGDPDVEKRVIIEGGSAIVNPDID